MLRACVVMMIVVDFVVVAPAVCMCWMDGWLYVCVGECVSVCVLVRSAEHSAKLKRDVCERSVQKADKLKLRTGIYSLAPVFCSRTNARCILHVVCAERRRRACETCRFANCCILLIHFVCARVSGAHVKGAV